MVIPISHIHVKILQKKKHRGKWFALMQVHTGEEMWIQQPSKPKIGDEQIIYVIKGGSKESDTLEQMMDRGTDLEEMDQFIKATARKYGELCMRTFAEAEAQENEAQPGRN